MMDDKKRFYTILTIFAFILISLSSTAFAQSDSLLIRVTPIEDEISIFDQALFNVSILNLRDEPNRVSMYSPNINAWTVRFSPDALTLAPDELRHIQLRISPKSIINPGVEYGVLLNFRSSLESRMQIAYAFVNVKTQEQIDMENPLIISVDMPEIGEIDPTEPKIIAIEIENKNIRNITNLEMLIRSDAFQQRVITDLNPLEKKSVQFTLNVPSSTPPHKGNAILTLRSDNQTILSRSSDYEIMEVEMHDHRAERYHSFMRTVHDVNIANQGNLPTVGKYRVSTNVLNYFFIMGDANSRLIRTDRRFFKEFNVDLQPGESYNLRVVISYRPILYVLLGILLLVTFYYLFRSPLIIKKSVSSIKMKEGSLSELKILLHIKNRTRRTFDELIVLDRIPKITEVKKDFEIGTIKPNKVMTHDKKGTIIRWDIPSIDSYEERVIAYKIFSNLNILGGLTLPIAMLKYMPLRGKEKKVSSNKIKLVIQKFTGEKKE